MYDTISIRSPHIPDLIYLQIVQATKRLEQIDMETGEVLWQVTTAELVGSYDSRMQIRFMSGNKIMITGSPHKFILGHNVLGGPDDIRACCRYLVSLAMYRLGIKLPLWAEWELMRADVTYCFGLASQAEVKEFFKMMRGCTYPRREAMNFGLNSVYFKGAATTLKAYNKGPEFRVHDKPRLKKLNSTSQLYTKANLNLLEKVGDRIVRWEVEVRKRKLVYDKINNMCGNLNDWYFEKVYIDEVCKVMKEGAQEMEIVRSIDDVKTRLKDVYPGRKANNLFGIWSRIQMESEATVKNSVSQPTWWRYTKDLAAAGVSLKGAVKILPGLEVVGGSSLRNFVPLPGNQYEVAGIFCDINEAIKQLELTA